jgi:maltose phosphorylase
MDATQRPINKNGLGTVLRSPYIKQADVLQCFYFFEEFLKGRIETQLRIL